MAGKVKSKKAREEIEKLSASLNDRQKLFCILYTTDKFCFGNATKSYIEAYNLQKEQYESARRMGYHLLTNIHIKKFISKFLDEQLKEEAVDRQLAKVVTQDKDLRSKVAAITEYNKLKARITEKHDITSDGEPIAAINYLLPNGTDNKADTQAA